jgi:3-dehydroquinate synthase
MKLSSAEKIERVFLYGPPASGKSSLGRQLAQDLCFGFIDLDKEIQRQAGMSVEQIFAVEGETGFRQHESQALLSMAAQQRCVIALGGGALLRAENRQWVEQHGQVVCLSAPLPVLLSRLQSDATPRPLVAGEAASRLEELMELRAAHYASFELQLDSSGVTPSELSRQVQGILGLFLVTGMQKAYDVRVYPGAIAYTGEFLKLNALSGPVAVVTDENVAAHHLQTVLDALQTAGYSAQAICLPAGESHKTMAAVMNLWAHFLHTQLERSSTVVALGGGVVGDLAGFAAATYLRGVNWVAVPTSLLAMVDASLGGKTGADLPEGKNLVGVFHAPRLVLSDPLVLATLPDDEIRNGMAEVIKHALINDPGLLELISSLVPQYSRQGYLEGDECAQSDDGASRRSDYAARGESIGLTWTQLVRRAIAVKIQVILDDPFEDGRRASLNLGHTLGHAIEQVSGYRVKHGEGVAIGMVAVLRAAMRLGLAQPQFLDELICLLRMTGLPTEVPEDLEVEALFSAMAYDKKRKGGKVRFVLPIQPGEVRWGVELPDYKYLLGGQRNA